jgi:Helicase associated domain
MDKDDVEPTPVLQDDEGVHVYPPPPLMEQDASPPQQHDETTANIINDTAEQPTSNAATVSERTGDNETWQLLNSSGNYRNNNEINHPPDAFVTAPDAALGGNAAAAASFTDAAADDAANNSDHNLSEDVAAASTTSTTEEAAVAITLETSTPFRKRKRYRKRKRDPKAPKLPRSALELYQRDTRKAFVSKHGAAKLPKDFMVQKEVAFCQFAGKDLQRWKVAEAQDLLRYQQEMLHYRPSEGYDANGNLIIATENENESKRRRKTLEEEGESQEREEESDDDEDDDEEEDSDDEQDEENGQSMSTTLTEYDQEALARLEREAKAKAKAKAKEEKAKAKENKARHKAAKNALNEEIADGPQYIPTPSLSLASASFNDMVYELLKYKTAKGNCRVPAKKGGVLGKWVDKLRKEYKKRKNGNNKTAASQANTAKDPSTKSSLAVQDNMRLDDERVDVLTELGMVWEFPNDDYEHIWQTRFKELVDFKEQHGHVNVPQKGHGSLSWWVKIQRELYVNTTSDHSKLPPRSRPRQVSA